LPERNERAERPVSHYRFLTIDTGWDRISVARCLARGADTCHLVAGVIEGKLYVASGLERTSAGIFTSRKLDIYDPGTNQWSSGTAMPEPQGRITGAVLGGRLFVIGGEYRQLCSRVRPRRGVTSNR